MSHLESFCQSVLHSFFSFHVCLNHFILFFSSLSNILLLLSVISSSTSHILLFLQSHSPHLLSPLLSSSFTLSPPVFFCLSPLPPLPLSSFHSHISRPLMLCYTWPLLPLSSLTSSFTCFSLNSDFVKTCR